MQGYDIHKLLKNVNINMWTLGQGYMPKGGVKIAIW